MNFYVIIFLYSFHLINGKELLHHSMHDDEIETVFHRKREVMHEIDYEVVQLNNQLKRSTPTVSLNAFNNNYFFHLEKNDVLLGDRTPIIYAHSCDMFGNNAKYSAYSFDLPYMEMYHDRKKRATFITYQDVDGKTNIEGIIGQNILIKPLPRRVHSDVLKVPAENQHHVVIRTKKWTYINENYEALKNKVPNFGPQPKKSWDNFGNGIDDQLGSTSLFSVEDKVVYVETLVAVDYDFFQIHGNNFNSLAKYMAAFWNAVDLKYRTIRNPEIRFNIAGLLVPENPKCAPFIENNFVEPNELKVSKTLEDIALSFNKNPFENKIDPSYVKINYDLVVVMTNRTLRDEKMNGRKYLGIASEGSVCGIADVYAGSAVIGDNGGFSGIMTAAHELAHALGAPHDEDQYFDSVTNTHKSSCEATDKQYLMHSLGGGFYWSPCTINILRHKVRQDSAICLRNKPYIGKPYIKTLPGKDMSRDEQCKKLTYDGIFYEGAIMDEEKSVESYDCLRLNCYFHRDGILYHQPMAGIPAEGSNCGHEKICLDGQCVEDPYKSSRYFY